MIIQIYECIYMFFLPAGHSSQALASNGEACTPVRTGCSIWNRELGEIPREGDSLHIQGVCRTDDPEGSGVSCGLSEPSQRDGAHLQGGSEPHTEGAVGGLSLASS